LEHVVQSLPAGTALCVFDAYRPLVVQQALWDLFAAEIAARYPTESATEREQRVRQFVAFPEPNPVKPPPHRTGGAVDVYLVDEATGVMLPMGTEPDEVSPRSVTDWYERHPEEPFVTNRRLLKTAMEQAGFVNYEGEWWHYEYGTTRWAQAIGAVTPLYAAA
jgi:D-alanyl-D-alanine dipeptidase